MLIEETYQFLTFLKARSLGLRCQQLVSGNLAQTKDGGSWGWPRTAPDASWPGDGFSPHLHIIFPLCLFMFKLSFFYEDTIHAGLENMLLSSFHI